MRNHTSEVRSCPPLLPLNLTSQVTMEGYRSLFGLGLVAGLVALWLPMIVHFVIIGGVFQTPTPTVLGEGQGPIRIEDTIHCEDVHHYRPANLLFTACEDIKDTRFDWFPGLGHLKPHPPARGSIHVIDPKVRQNIGCEPVQMLTLLFLFVLDIQFQAADFHEL